MRCSDCERLRGERERAIAAHREFVYLHKADSRNPRAEHVEIWDFILEVALKARTDAEYALEDHRAKHKPWLVRSTSAIFVALLEANVWDYADELLGAF